MSRILLTILAALTIAAPAAAQGPLDGSATLTVSGLPERAVANGTQHSQQVNVVLNVAQGTCTGGSESITVTLAADAGNTTVEVQPRTFTFQVGPTDTANDGVTFPGTATIIVDAGVVSEETEVDVNVTATSSDITCSVAVFGGVAPAVASGSYTVEFYPLDGVNQTPTTEEPVPGFELPFLLAAIGGVLVMLRRRKA